MSEQDMVIEKVTDPREIERARQQDARHRKNSEWLASHWDELLPQARGKFIAVAGQQAFIAQTAEEAWSWTRRTFPDDNGAIVRFVRTQKGPRIYADRR